MVLVYSPYFSIALLPPLTFSKGPLSLLIMLSALRSARTYCPLSSRYLHSSTIAFNIAPKHPPKRDVIEQKDERKNQPDQQTRRPLSRVLIGGSKESSKKFRSDPIEFSSWKAILVLLGVGGAFTYWFSFEKEKLRLRKEADSKRGMGNPHIGGDFNLIDTKSRPFTQENLKNDDKIFSIIYFGFTHCPDVCPDELDKLGEMLNILKKDHNITLQPIFITCDPARDSPEVIEHYLKDFHPSIVGLTGIYEEVKKVCKKYRVYFSTPPDVQTGQDYLVDHSIFFYLMDSEGNFLAVIGREFDSQLGAEQIYKLVDAYLPEAELEEKKNSWLGFLYK